MPFKHAKAFAKSVLAGNQLPLQVNPALIKTKPGQYCETVIFRKDNCQIEMIYLFPFADIPLHRHPHCDAAELWLGGLGNATIDNMPLSVIDLNKDLRKNISRTPINAWHGGSAGEKGVMYLSFQIWQGMSPTFISDDWVQLES